MRKHSTYLICMTVLILTGFFSISISFAQTDSITPAEASKHIGGTKTVCGRVVSATYAARSKGQPTFLNLDQPYPNQIFTVVVWGSDRKKFRDVPEVIFKGKTVCVTGKIDTFRGKPQIIVRDPSQIVTKSDSSSSIPLTSSPYHQRYTVDERKLLKTILAFLGYSLDFTTDEWNKQTQEAVRTFQQTNGLTMDGIIGPKTLLVIADSIEKTKNLNNEQKSKLKQFLHALAVREDLNILGSQRESAPSSGHFRPRYYAPRKHIREGDEVEYYDYEKGEYKSGEVESISGDEVEIYDSDSGEYRYVDIDDVED